MFYNVCICFSMLYRVFITYNIYITIDIFTITIDNKSWYVHVIISGLRITQTLNISVQRDNEQPFLHVGRHVECFYITTTF